METSVMFLDCPEYMDKHGAARCGLPAVVEYRYTMKSTDGPLESARIRCPRGHCFNGPLESLTWEKAACAALRPQAIREQDAAPRRNG
jgi:hypothetical protein